LSCHVYVLMWCSFAVNLLVVIGPLVVTLQKKLSSGSHKVTLTENRTVGVMPTSRLWGGGALRSLLLPRTPKTLVTPWQPEALYHLRTGSKLALWTNGITAYQLPTLNDRPAMQLADIPSLRSDTFVWVLQNVLSKLQCTIWFNEAPIWSGENQGRL